MIKEHCELCDRKNSFRCFTLGIDIISVIRGLREREGKEKSGNDGAAYKRPHNFLLITCVCENIFFEGATPP